MRASDYFNITVIKVVLFGSLHLICVIKMFDHGLVIAIYNIISLLMLMHIYSMCRQPFKVVAAQGGASLYST